MNKNWSGSIGEYWVTSSEAIQDGLIEGEELREFCLLAGDGGEGQLLVMVIGKSIRIA